MQVDIRPAMPLALPKTGTLGPRRARLVRGVATVATVLTAAVAVLVVAMSAVLLGLT